MAIDRESQKRMDLNDGSEWLIQIISDWLCHFGVNTQYTEKFLFRQSIQISIQRPSEMTAGRACFAVVEPLRGSAGSPVATGFMWQLIAAIDIS